jgi:shikimate kinase
MMGVGKTSVGRMLAARLGRPFFDLDAEVEQEVGLTVPQLFERAGEAAFRELEHRALERLLHGSSLVLATGGGAVLDPRNRELLRQRAFTIWLDAAPATLVARVGDASDRPLLEAGNREERLEQLLAERHPFYSEAKLRVATDGLNRAEVVARVITRLGP